MVGSKCYGNKKDRRQCYDDAVGLDMEEGHGVDIVHDFEKPLSVDDGVFDHIDCCSVLEHVQRPWKMAENIESVMKPGSTILLQVPYVWRVHNYPGDYWRFTIQSFDILFPNIKWLQRGYLMGDIYRKMPNSLHVDGKKYMQRSEATGFGVFVS